MYIQPLTKLPQGCMKLLLGKCFVELVYRLIRSLLVLSNLGEHVALRRGLAHTQGKYKFKVSHLTLCFPMHKRIMFTIRSKVMHSSIVLYSSLPFLRTSKSSIVGVFDECMICTFSYDKYIHYA